MKKNAILFLLLLWSQYGIAQLVINELDCDNTGLDDKEFIEIKSINPSSLEIVPNFSLDGYIIVLFNGSNSGGDSSYFRIDLNGSITDDNGLLLIGSETVTPLPQLIIPPNVIQNGADAVAIYQAQMDDFIEGTLATTTNLIDVLVYSTNDADDNGLLALLGETIQVSEGASNNTNSIQLNNDGISYAIGVPTPRVLNDNSGNVHNPITISTAQEQYNEGDGITIVFTTEMPIDGDLTFSISLDNGTFDVSDFTGNTTVTMLSGQTTVSVPLTIIEDTLDEGDEELVVRFLDLQLPYIANNYMLRRVVDNDFTITNYGSPTASPYPNPAPNPLIVQSTQPDGYYDSANGFSGVDLRQALQNIVADQSTVRAQTYTDVIEILKEADVNPANSNEVWLVYREQGRPKLDYQVLGSSTGKWNREHTFPRSLGGFGSIDLDEIADGKDVYWITNADSLRHANSDAHALRAADGPENSSRGNQHYGQYNGPSGNLSSFKGDVARSVLFLALRYNGLEVVNGYPSVTGQMGDLATLLDWHRNDPPDDFEMNRNNVVYTWQINRNPFIDHPDLVEYIWGDNSGDVWNATLTVDSFTSISVKMYPNPATNGVYIAGIKNKYMLSVFTAQGRKIASKNYSGNTYLELNLPAGMYVIKIDAETNSVIKKLIVK
ncbi:T9SS type A sorting domain-containing protein [Bizionia gelidisalsuginis]|uniref:T9SS type A sorting domain-containing protein n=1 Tax=Bizionia gelidisalsuginis TaxID=291188 RepID=A0ABY3MDU2_9FLAO|nr:endonuclease [Bizionia gelidisalsuginis]TYC17172.1 T9SS type A sorting domain-containing protein [Bizionia gelidisalsuginis]